MIKNDEWYTLYDIAEMNLVPQLASVYLIKKWINAGKLRAVKVGNGLGTKYSIKGNWVINFIAKFEAGDFH